MRAEAYPGEDQATLRTPEDVAELFVARLPCPIAQRLGRSSNSSSGGPPHPPG